MMRLTGVLLSTPNPIMAGAFEKPSSWDFRVQSANGDTADLSRADKREEKRALHRDAGEVCIAFASPFAIIEPKMGTLQEDELRPKPGCICCNHGRIQ